MSIQSAAMLVNLNISQWAARKHDKKSSQEIATAHQVSIDSGRYTKQIIPKKYLEKLARLARATRTYHYTNTLPWLDDGSRILPSELFFEYTTKITEFKAKFAVLVDEFLANYAGIVSTSQAELKTMFDQNEYPHVNELRNKFAITVTMFPVPDSADFRVAIPEADLDKLRADVAVQIEKAATHAQNDIWKRMGESMLNVHDKLIDMDNLFRNSLIDNVISLTALMPKLNVANNADINTICDDIGLNVTRYPAETIRSNKSVRESVAIHAHRIHTYCQTMLATPETAPVEETIESQVPEPDNTDHVNSYFNPQKEDTDGRDD